MISLYSKVEMIRAVRTFLVNKGFTLRSNYDPIFQPARVPIFAYKEGEEEGEEIFVDIITESHIDPEVYFKDRTFGRSMSEAGLEISNASSAQFFRHYFPNCRVYWAIADYVNQDDNFQSFVENCRNEHIGLLEVSGGEDDDFTVSEKYEFAVPLLEERLEKLKKDFGIADAADGQKKISNVLRNWSQEDLSYLVFYPEPKYLATDISIRDEVCNISRELINKMSELENLSYNDMLHRFSETYYSKTADDYSIAFEVTQRLWDKYGIRFPSLHRDFEEVLKLDQRYRDHFLHAFQVFLYGAYVIDKMHAEIGERNFGADVGDRIEDAWLIAATYHDFNYMIQQFDDWTKRFFVGALHLEPTDKSPALLQLSESYVRRGYMFNTKRVAHLLPMIVNEITLDFLYDRILEKKNHGLISGLSLLKYMEVNNGSKFTDRVVNSACKAISIHDGDIWKFLCGLVDDSGDDEVGNKFKRLKILEKVRFDEDPISFLLIFADSVQEEGRSRTVACKAELEKFYFEDSMCFSEISFSGEASNDAFKRKIQEFEEIKEFLLGTDRFHVKLTDIESAQSHSFRI